MHIETSVVVDRPIDEVWAFLTDPFNRPRLGGATLAFRQTPPGPPTLGSTAQMRLSILGFEGRMSLVLTDWDPPWTFAFSARGLGLRSVSYRERYEATADGTKVVRVAEAEPRPAFSPLWWIVWPLLGRRVHATNQRLKRLLEAGPSEPRGSIDAR